MLTDLGGATRVTLTRAPLGTSPEWDEWYDDITEGWTTFLQQLRFGLECHPGQDRRTVYLDVSRPGQPDPVPLLRVTDLPEAGTGWFRSARALGLVLSPLGPGLIVAGAKPVRPGSEGAAVAILTGYGLTDEARAAAREALAGWWRAHYPAAAEPV